MAGRPRYVPEERDRRLVTVLKATGASNATIALEMDVPLRTLERHFRTELAEGKDRIIAKIATGLLGRALNGDNTASIFVMKTLGGWSERTKVTVVDADGNAVQPTEAATVHIHLPSNGRDPRENT